MYDRSATESCLREKGYSPESVPDGSLVLVGGPAANGVIEIESEDTGIDIAFEANSDASKERADTLEGAATAFGGEDVSDVIETKGNVTYWAIGDRPDDEFADVDACLSE